MPPRIPDDARPVAFEPIGRDVGPLHGPQDPVRLVFRDTGAWSRFWDSAARRAGLTAPAPSVDFDRHVVVAVGMGERPTGGYAISVEGVFEAEGRAWVDVLETAPGPGCMTLQVITSPLDLVRVALASGDVSFVERRETRAC